MCNYFYPITLFHKYTFWTSFNVNVLYYELHKRQQNSDFSASTYILLKNIMYQIVCLLNLIQFCFIFYLETLAILKPF